ncbi:hypothetical protein PRZ48_010281 [Zasmidium cellare]|uniref:Glycosyltransferase family 31 protein n=1 Tax=Zasmidium cellare TaxID=395010 RepID=A0ABR0E869_ZASCE|nr:hypothetical protein PRZ48_010281 [Zasmidium cellare]
MSAVLTGRGVTLTRLAVIFGIIVAIFIFRDAWLPRAEDAYNHAKGSFAQHQNDLPSSNSEDVPTIPITPIHTSPEPDSTIERPAHTFNETCLHLPGAEKVMVMLKTGATELYQKLPTHFVTTFSCIPKFMIFSDLEQTFGDVKIHDAIAPVSKKIREEHEDFKLYREIEKWQREGQDMGKLKGDSGWNLDKWKFLPMFHMAFEAADDEIEWFVMIEADTSLSWLNLLLWLEKMDPKKPYYLGAQNVIGETTFGHGGSGIVMSRKAADVLEAARYNAGKELYDTKWEEATAASCCGDAIVAEAFLAVDIPLTPAWPLIQGETISTVDFTDNHWCTPPITFHHVTPIEVDSYWQFEKQWTDTYGWTEPYLYRDVFHHFLEQHVSVNRTHWNNMSKDYKFATYAMSNEDDDDWDTLEKYEQEATESEEACAKACLQKGEEECIQWMFSPGRCHLGKDIRFGKSDAHEEEHWNCGWIQERIASFRESFEDCEVRWEG